MKHLLPKVLDILARAYDDFITWAWVPPLSLEKKLMLQEYAVRIAAEAGLNSRLIAMNNATAIVLQHIPQVRIKITTLAEIVRMHSDSPPFISNVKGINEEEIVIAIILACDAKAGHPAYGTLTYEERKTAEARAAKQIANDIKAMSVVEFTDMVKVANCAIF
jgi:hypothetical protein